MLFQPLKAGQKINRAFFNDLISFCNSLVLRGDGKTTQVTHTAGGTTVSAVIPDAKVDTAHRFRLFFSGGQCTIPAWPCGRGYRGSYGTGGFRLGDLSRVTIATPQSGEFLLVAYCNGGSSSGISWGWAWPSVSWPQGITVCPVALCNFTDGELNRPPTYFIKADPIMLVDQPRHPFMARAVIASADPGAVYTSATDIPVSSIEVEPGFLTLPKAGVADMIWTHSGGRTFAISDLSNSCIITLTMRSAGFSFGVESTTVTGFTGPAWDGSANTATIPIARWQNGVIAQYATSNIYAAPIYVP